VSASTSQIKVWWNGDPNAITTIATNRSNSSTIFVTDDLDIFVDNGCLNGGIDRWNINGTKLASPMPFASGCRGLFLAINNNLYCSLREQHQVISKSVSNPSNAVIVEAGMGCSGSASDRLSNPEGIFVTSSLDLYVADSNNHRVQLFRQGNLTGITVAGTGAAGSFNLSYPTGVTLDADGYLYIVDWGNNRIIGSDQNGFRCVVGCSGSSGSASNQLALPWSLSFDTIGNLFVMDSGNVRIQKFMVINGSCGK
jgi:DNA-binding beta-propeller fold protein YncE